MKKTGLKEKIALLSCGLLMMGSLSAFPVHAETTKDTPVIYDNREIIDVDANGRYGVIVPVGITFNKVGDTCNADVSVVGINGFDLDRDFEELRIKSSVQSKNSYELKNDAGASGGTYELTMTGNAAAMEQNDQFQSFADLGLETADSHKEIKGTAKLKISQGAKGVYKDVLQYKFVESAAKTK